MFNQNIVPLSSGSLSVAFLSLILAVMQLIFYFRKTNYKWFVWSAAISFSSIIYAIGIFLEYNSTGSLNRFAGLLEFTAIIFLIHSFYGFTFSRLEINPIHYHTVAGVFHCIVLLFLWFSSYVVSDSFMIHNFCFMESSFVEPALGPLGWVFEIYILLSCIIAIILWLGQKGPDLRSRRPFLVGMIFWLLLGLNDGLTSLEIFNFMYLMEYGFLAFSISILWVVFESFVDISAEDKYRVITEHANDGIIVIQHKRIIFTNTACSLIFGDSLLKLSIDEFIRILPPEERSTFFQHYEKLMESADSEGLFTVRLISDIREEVFEVKGTLITYRKNPAALFILRNVTERLLKEEELKKSEEKILRLKRMESLGQLAGGVAHDLNNVLSGIVTYPELILLDLPEDSKIRKPIETMQDAGKRAAAIVNDLLTMARGVAIEKKTINLNSVLTKFFRTPEYEKITRYHPDIQIESNLASDLMNIKGAADYLNRLVMNLLSNACEAIDGSGNVIIETMNRYLDRPLKGYNDVKIGEYVVLSVSDNGPGISTDDFEQIFEPFYTKKVMGRSGTGLGLTVVWNIVQDHNGYINVITDRNATRFEIYFPITRDSILDRDIMALGEKIYGNGETILIVDDVRSQREMLSHILELLKYKTISFGSGEEAIEYLKKNSVDLIVLDMIMDPGINGRVTYEIIKKIHPEQKAIIVSGFAETEDVKETLKMGAGRFLEKPVSMTEFGLAVKVELEK